MKDSHIRALRFMLIAIAFTFFFVIPEVAEACPTCKAGLGGKHDGAALGYYYSIIFMMATPFMIFTFWGLYIYRVCKNNAFEENELVGESIYSQSLLG